MTGATKRSYKKPKGEAIRGEPNKPCKCERDYRQYKTRGSWLRAKREQDKKIRTEELTRCWSCSIEWLQTPNATHHNSTRSLLQSDRVLPMLYPDSVYHEGSTTQCKNHQMKG